VEDRQCDYCLMCARHPLTSLFRKAKKSELTKPGLASSTAFTCKPHNVSETCAKGGVKWSGVEVAYDDDQAATEFKNKKTMPQAEDDDESKPKPKGVPPPSCNQNLNLPHPLDQPIDQSTNQPIDVPGRS
jgi:hypothetical protein